MKYAFEIDLLCTIIVSLQCINHALNVFVVSFKELQFGSRSLIIWTAESLEVFSLLQRDLSNFSKQRISLNFMLLPSDRLKESEEWSILKYYAEHFAACWQNMDVTVWHGKALLWLMKWCRINGDSCYATNQKDLNSIDVYSSIHMNNMQCLPIIHVNNSFFTYEWLSKGASTLKG